ncbi:MAG: RnfABCDGE type electron transport complex subunit D [Alphaproteobacteria bacterium]
MSLDPKDPRYAQITILSILTILQMFWADFGPSPAILALNVSTALAVQYACSRMVGMRFDFRSPLITSLSLTVLLKASALWIYPLAVLVAIGSKFILRAGGSHIFNPANIGIVAMLLAFPHWVWVAPGQWGSALWLAFLLAAFGCLVLYRVPSRDMTLFFLGGWLALIFGRALWLGDPLAIPLHQIQNGAMLIFAFFMISDPKTIPVRWPGRLIFALAVCVIAFILNIEWHIRESLFYALALVCMARPALDSMWRAERRPWVTEGGKS